MRRKLQNILGIAGLFWSAKFIYSEVKKINYFKDKVALITGGSKGLGLTIAEELLKAGAKVIICARDSNGLFSAQEHLKTYGGQVEGYVCDVGNQSEVDRVICEVVANFGRIDLIFNNAGIITVGSMESLTEREYQKSLDVMYWGIVHTTTSAVPFMKKQGHGQIINITSIGGEISVPHLLSYSAAKFAAVGYSKGCASELRKDNIFVTTIVPGLMRTGSYVNAEFPKDKKEEFKLFSFLASTPGFTLSPQRAVRIILEATKEKKAYQILGLQNKLAIKFSQLFPNTVINLFSVVNRFLPYSEKEQYERGQSISEKFNDAEFKISHGFGKKAQQRHQLRS